MSLIPLALVLGGALASITSHLPSETENPSRLILVIVS